jgi:NTP pyrophosphatase (non-canonical NTP hydrolase)
MTIQEQALKHFGTKRQMGKYKEECCEAVAAIQRWEANDTPENYQHMIEEIADVENVTVYPRLIFGNEDIDNAKQAKLDRLAETIRGKG